MSETDRHHLPLLAAGQAQKEVTHNEALVAIDRQLHLAIISRRLAIPPATPVAGDAYLVPAGAGGIWAGRTGAIASHDGFGWAITLPVRGCIAWIIDEACFSVFDGGWSSQGWPVDALVIAGRRVLGAAPAAVAAPGGGGTIDAESRATITSLLITLRNQGIIA